MGKEFHDQFFPGGLILAHGILIEMPMHGIQSDPANRWAMDQTRLSPTLVAIETVLDRAPQSNVITHIAQVFQHFNHARFTEWRDQFPDQRKFSLVGLNRYSIQANSLQLRALDIRKHGIGRKGPQFDSQYDTQDRAHQDNRDQSVDIHRLSRKEHDQSAKPKRNRVQSQFDHGLRLIELLAFKVSGRYSVNLLFRDNLVSAGPFTVFVRRFQDFGGIFKVILCAG